MKDCVECGRPFEGYNPQQVTCSLDCRVARRDRMRRDRERAASSPRKCRRCETLLTGSQFYCSDACKSPPSPPRKCLRCDTLLPPRKQGSGNQRYCSVACRAPLPQCDDGATPCVCTHCGRAFNAVRKRKFCTQTCRNEDFKARHDEGTNEIPVVDIDEAPRRLAVAKLFDRFEGADGGAFNHFTPLQWMNAADRRFAR